MHPKSCPTFVTLWTVDCQAPVSMRSPGKNTESGLPSPPPGNLSDAGIKTAPPAAPILQADSLLLSHWKSPTMYILWDTYSIQFSSVHSVMSNSLWPHGLQHIRPSCPSWVRSNSCPLSQWCHPTISSSVIPFSSCSQSFPASGYFQMSQFFASVAKVLEFQFQHQFFQWIFRTNLIILFVVFIGKLTLVRLSIDIFYVKVTDVLQETESFLLFSDLIYAIDLLPHYFTLLSSYILLYSFLWPLTMLVTLSLYDPFSSIGPLSVRMLQGSVSSHLLITLLK